MRIKGYGRRKTCMYHVYICDVFSKCILYRVMKDLFPPGNVGTFFLQVQTLNLQTSSTVGDSYIQLYSPVVRWQCPIIIVGC